MDLLLCVLGIVAVFPYLVASDELGDTRSVFNLTTEGLKLEPTVVRDRLYINRYPSRFEQISRYTTSLKLIISTCDDTDICFHLIPSRAIGTCPDYLWKRLSNDTMIRRSSPFGLDLIIDVKVANSSLQDVPLITVSAEEDEWFMHRIVCLILGTILLSLIKILEGRCLAFYVSMSMVAGIFLTILLVLFQGIKRLRSLVLYPLLLGLIIVVYPCIPDWYQCMVIGMGFGQDDTRLGLQFLFLFRRLVLGLFPALYATKFFAMTGDGSIDKSTFQFVSRSLWIFGAVLILQSSSDLYLAGGALVSVIAVTRLICLIGLHEIVINLLHRNWEVIAQALGPRINKFMQEIHERGEERMRKRELYPCNVCRLTR